MGNRGSRAGVSEGERPLAILGAGWAEHTRTSIHGLFFKRLCFLAPVSFSPLLGEQWMGPRLPEAAGGVCPISFF